MLFFTVRHVLECPGSTTRRHLIRRQLSTKAKRFQFKSISSVALPRNENHNVIQEDPMWPPSFFIAVSELVSVGSSVA